MSAGNVASLTAGVYRYVAHRDELLFLATSGYERETLIDAAFGQDWIAAAPACICIAAVFERTTVKYGKSGPRIRLPGGRTCRRKPDAAGDRARSWDGDGWGIQRHQGESPFAPRRR